MKEAYLSLSALDVTLAVGFIIVAAIISFIFKLALSKPLAVGTLRTAAQLLIAGYALSFVFSINKLWLVVLLALFMIALSAREAINRQRTRVPGVAWDVVAGMTLSALLVSLAVTSVVVGADPWWRPSIFIPLLGMILGNSLNGVSISLERFLAGCVNERDAIETRLILGATPQEALAPLVRESLRAGMMPIINAMAIVGVVSLPGMMTGQLIAGADPMQAVKYQIVVMYMLAASTAFAGSLSVLLARRRVMTREWALRPVREFQRD